MAGKTPVEFLLVPNAIVLMYSMVMSKRSILKANPYLRNAAQRKEMLFQSVASSSAIEGVWITKHRMAAGRYILKNALTTKRKRTA